MNIKPITDRKIWDEFINSHYSESYPFFQMWEWGEVQKDLGNTVYTFGIFIEEKLQGLILLVGVKAKRGHYIFWRHGPVLLNFSPAIFAEILAYIKILAKKEGASFIRISRFFKTETITKKLFAEYGFIASPLQTIDAQFCWVLDIKKSEDELLKNMRKSHRYLIKKAQSLGLTIKKSINPEDMTLFFPLYKKLAARQHFTQHKGLREEFTRFVKENKAVLFFAEYNKKIIAVAFIVYANNIAIYRHAASDEEYRNIPASYLLQWEAIREAKKQGKILYNFWGVAPEGVKNHPWSGLTLFKTGFGGTYEYFLPTMDLPLSIFYWKTYLIDLITKLKR